MAHLQRMHLMSIKYASVARTYNRAGPISPLLSAVIIRCNSKNLGRKSVEMLTLASYYACQEDSSGGRRTNPTSIKVSADVNCPVRRRCNATARSKATADSGEVNKGLSVGRGLVNFYIFDLASKVPNQFHFAPTLSKALP